jgi:hypothetical protein
VLLTNGLALLLSIGCEGNDVIRCLHLLSSG